MKKVEVIQGDPAHTGGSLMSDAEYTELHRRGPIPPAGGEVEMFSLFDIPLSGGGNLWRLESKTGADRRRDRLNNTQPAPQHAIDKEVRALRVIGMRQRVKQGRPLY